MSCDDVADCIENDEGVQAALAAQIASNPSNQTTVYQTSVYGAPLNTAQRAAPLAEPPGCDLDILFAMCTAIIDQAHLNNQDFLEILEAASNPTERARNVISAIPVIGLLPIDEAIEVIDQMVEEIQENYDAQWTTAIRDELRCELFCRAKEAEDCIITFDMLTGVFEDRLGYYLDPVNTALAVLQYFISSTWAGTTVVDIMMLVQFGIWRSASEFLGVNIRTLQIVARLVIDNPDPDWEILCEDCAEPPTGDCLDFTVSQQGWTPRIGRGIYQPGEGLGPLGAPDGYVFFWQGPAPYEGESTEIVMHSPVASTGWLLQSGVGNTLAYYNGPATTTPTFNEGNASPGYFPFPNVAGYRLIPDDEAAPPGFVLSELCFTPA